MVQFSGSAPLLSPPREQAEAVKFKMELAEAVASGGGTFPVGELVISLDTARAQAREAVHPAAMSALDSTGAALALMEAEREVLRILLTHGMLHLLGFTHEERLIGSASTDQECFNAAKMGRAEDALMKSLGWKGQGLVFAHFTPDC